MIVRIGLPKTVGALPGEVERMGAPALVSAMSLWDGKRGQFRRPGSAIGDLDCALDSAGFVAMSHFGRYPWTPEQYVELAGRHSWAWWASMDFCCEPEVAGDRAEVALRVFNTAYHLGWCRKIVNRWSELGAEWLTYPMPVLQGWFPDDYAESVFWTNDALLGTWPRLVGVGSVCRRNLHGPDGIFAVLDRLDAILPPYTRLHLFGVKGAALGRLAEHPRVFSTDSQAWGMQARHRAREAGASCTIADKKAELRRWYAKQAGAVVEEVS